MVLYRRGRANLSPPLRRESSRMERIHPTREGEVPDACHYCGCVGQGRVLHHAYRYSSRRQPVELWPHPKGGGGMLDPTYYDFTQDYAEYLYEDAMTA